MQRGQHPVLAAIFRVGQVWAIILGTFVVSAHDHPMGRVAECNRKDPRRVGPVHYWSFVNLPALPSIPGMEYARRLAPGCEPDIRVRVPAHNRNASIRCRESSLTFHCVWHLCRRNGPPVLPILGQKNFKLEFSGLVRDGIAPNDAVLRIPEARGVIKSLGIGIGELKLPML